MGAKIGLQKIEEKDMQFLIENIFAKIENKKPYETKTKKNQKLWWRLKKTTGVSIRSCFMKYFIQYENTLAPDEIDQLDADLKANGWGVKSIVDWNRRLHWVLQWKASTDNLLPIPGGETPDGWLLKNILKDHPWNV